MSSSATLEVRQPCAPAVFQQLGLLLLFREGTHLRVKFTSSVTLELHQACAPAVFQQRGPLELFLERARLNIKFELFCDLGGASTMRASSVSAT